jgi:hypothetical protein
LYSSGFLVTLPAKSEESSAMMEGKKCGWSAMVERRVEKLFSVSLQATHAQVADSSNNPKMMILHGAPNLERRRLLLRGATSRVSSSRNEAGKKAKISSNAKKVH